MLREHCSDSGQPIGAGAEGGKKKPEAGRQTREEGVWDAQVGGGEGEDVESEHLQRRNLRPIRRSRAHIACLQA